MALEGALASASLPRPLPLGSLPGNASTGRCHALSTQAHSRLWQPRLLSSGEAFPRILKSLPQRTCGKAIASGGGGELCAVGEPITRRAVAEAPEWLGPSLAPVVWTSSERLTRGRGNLYPGLYLVVVRAERASLLMCEYLIEKRRCMQEHSAQQTICNCASLIALSC